MSYLDRWEFLTTTEIMREFKVVRRTVRRWVAAGELNPLPTLHSAHGEQRFSLEEIEAFRERRRCGRSMADIVAAALAHIAENADENRMLCPRCVERSVNRRGDFCTRCEQERTASFATRKSG
jgi:hypothetical protein